MVRKVRVRLSFQRIERRSIVVPGYHAAEQEANGDAPESTPAADSTAEPKMDEPGAAPRSGRFIGSLARTDIPVPLFLLKCSIARQAHGLPAGVPRRSAPRPLPLRCETTPNDDVGAKLAGDHHGPVEVAASGPSRGMMRPLDRRHLIPGPGNQPDLRRQDARRP